MIHPWNIIHLLSSWALMNILGMWIKQGTQWKENACRTAHGFLLFQPFVLQINCLWRLSELSTGRRCACDASRLGQGVGFLLNCILSPLADMTAVRGDILIVRVIIQVNHDTYWTFRLCYLTERPIFILRWILRWFLVELSFLPMFREETRKAIVFEMGLVWCVEFHVWRYGMCWDSGQK